MPKNEQLEPDLYISNEGSIFLVNPISDKGRQWLQENIDPEALMFHDAIVVEHRFIGAIVDGAQNDGLMVE